MRKGHGSTKVPGVKLRPQAPKASGSKSRKAEPSWLNPGDDGITEQTILNASKKPFVGITVCASCLPDKSAVFKKAIELGAQTSSDLTDIVTHLICLGPGSQKYSYCVRHGVPIMHPSWITDAYQKWLEGETVDPLATMQSHRLPVFATATLSLTGISNLDAREQMVKLTKTHGGQFVKDLGSSKVTHVVCGNERGDDVDERGWSKKMRYVERFNATHDEKVHLVWEEWFWDCLEFGGQLEEAGYNVNRPRPKRKTRRDNTPLLQPISSMADVRNQKSEVATPIDPEKGDLDEEIVRGKKVPGTSARVFEGLLKNKGFEVKSGKLVRSPSKAKAKEELAPLTLTKEPLNDSAGTSKGRDKTALSAFQRTKSFAPQGSISNTNEPSTSKLHMQRVASARQVPLLSSRPLLKSDTATTALIQPIEEPEQAMESKEVPSGEKYLFIGYKFIALGDAKSKHIHNEIKARGGEVVDDKFHADFILVRLSTGKRLRDEEFLDSLRSRFRTECWLEQCIFEERICKLSEHVAFAPLDVDTPLAGAENLKVHISGYPAHSKTFTIRLLKTIGASISDQLTRKVTHMLTCSETSAKYAKAQEWGVPCVGLQWLHDCVKFGKIQSIESYVLKKGESQQESNSGGPIIRDITNDEFVQGTSKSPSKPSPQPQSSTEPETLKSASTADGMELTWTPNGLLSNIVDDDTELGPSSPLKQPPANLFRTTTESSSTMMDLKVSPGAKRLRGAKDINPITVDDEQMNIPSSNTPSPVKLSKTTSSFSSPSKQSSNTLKSAITSLLGKRHTSDEQDAELNASTGSNGSKSAKRAKPLPRSKSKPTSSNKLRPGGDPLENQPTTIDYPLFAGENDLQIPGMEQNTKADDTIRVTYEDPGQVDEQRRLVRLLTSGPDADEPPANEVETKALPTKRGRNLVRRSTRN